MQALQLRIYVLRATTCYDHYDICYDDATNSHSSMVQSRLQVDQGWQVYLHLCITLWNGLILILSNIPNIVKL